MYEDSFRKLADEPEEALKIIERRHKEQLMKWIMLFISDDVELVKDVLSETLITMWCEREKVAGVEDPMAWMMMVAKYTALAKIRNEHKHLKVPIDALLEQEDPGTADSLTNYEELYSRFMAATAHLTPREKDVVIAAKIDGLDNKEIGDKHGLSVQHIKNVMSAAIKKVRTILKEK